MSSSAVEVLHFAAAEIQRYVELMRGSRPSIALKPGPTHPALFINTVPHDQFDLPQVPDPLFDDAFSIEMDGLSGYVAGSNARSVLFGVYRFLEELGCRWVRPGPRGEVVPDRLPAAELIRVREAAAHRHRGMCIEGAVSPEHLADMINFAPRLALNSYFLQYWDGDGELYAERWRRTAGAASTSSQTLYAAARPEMDRRGLLLHGGGHGWTSAVLGLPEFLAEPLREDDRAVLGLPPVAPASVTIPPDRLEWVAQISGHRKLWRSTPSNTNLCYSSAEARGAYVRRVVEQVASQPGIDIIHLWLADDYDNHCECEHCRRLRPSDHYVRMLNEVDRALTQAGKTIKVALLAYLDLLWAPQRERITNPDRFIFTFAPITRSYREALGPAQLDDRAPAFALNAIQLPRTADQHAALLLEWQKACSSDSLTYEYHFYRNQYHDLGSLDTASVLFADLRNLRLRGLNGFISCQSPRSSFPTGFGLALLGRALWRSDLDYEAERHRYFAAAFGVDGLAVARHLRFVADCLPAPYFTGERVDIERVYAGARALLDDGDGFASVVARNCERFGANDARRISWELMAVAQAVYTRIATIIIERGRGNLEGARANWCDLRAFLFEAGPVLQGALDTLLFVRELEPILAGEAEPPKPRLES